MCLYPRTIKNPKYLPNKKNGGVPPTCTDERLRYVQIKCGKCLECRKQKQREWVTRLSEELKHNEKAYFLTLTIDEEHMKILKEKYSLEDPNQIATKAHRLYLENYRKKEKKSPRHWSITELGEEKGRIHLHGIFWGNLESLIERWTFGFTYTGNFVNEKTINYITKYMLKENPRDRNFTGKVLCSKGIGLQYSETMNAKLINRWRGKETKEYYLLRNGQKTALPDYYKRKIFTEEQREQLRIYKEERGISFIMGEKYRTSDERTKHNLLQFYQKLSKEIIGSDFDEWERKKKNKKETELRKYIHEKYEEYKAKQMKKKRSKDDLFEEVLTEGHFTGYYDDDSFLRKRAENIPQARYKEGAT